MRYRALDHVFAIEVVGTPPVDLAAVLGGLAVDPEAGAAPDAVYRFTFADDGSDDGVLERDGDVIASGRTRVLLQILITRLGQAVSDADIGGAVHATTLRVGDGTVLLAGPTGRGKSTLSARLLLDGAALVAEDISVLDPTDLRVRTYHRPLGLSEASFEVLGIEIPPAAGEPCGCGGKVLATAQHLGAGVAGASRPTVVALVDREQDVLQSLSPAAALARILEAGVAPTPDRERDLDTLIRLLAGARCVTIGTADLDAAAEWITQLAGNPITEPVTTLVERHGDRYDVYAGTEAVIVLDDESHLLNQTAAAVWLLRTEGLDAHAIAAELDADRTLVEDALAEFDVAGLTPASA